MKVLNKSIPQNLKTWGLGILAAGMIFNACKKDSEDAPVVPQEKVYIFGTDTKPFDFDQIKADAASPKVSKIIFQSDETTWGRAVSAEQLRILALEPAFEAAAKKDPEGRGNIKDINAKDKTDSLWLVAKGFTVNKK